MLTIFGAPGRYIQAPTHWTPWAGRPPSSAAAPRW